MLLGLLVKDMVLQNETYDTMVVLSTHGREQEQFLNIRGFPKGLLDISSGFDAPLSLIGFIVGRRWNVKEGIRARKVEPCSSPHVALSSLKPFMVCKLSRNLGKVAVDTVNQGLGIRFEQVADSLFSGLA